MSEPGSVSIGFERTGSTPDGFQEALPAIHLSQKPHKGGLSFTFPIVGFPKNQLTIQCTIEKDHRSDF